MKTTLGGGLQNKTKERRKKVMISEEINEFKKAHKKRSTKFVFLKRRKTNKALARTIGQSERLVERWR